MESSATMANLNCLIFFSFTLTCIGAENVKLTMKQGLLMNQVISTYALNHAENIICKNHTDQFKNGLRAFEPWALNMFDSSAKIQSGILVGNLVGFGSFKQCIQINHEGIKGKHCMIKITPNVDLIKKILSFRNVTERRFPKVRLIVEKAALLWSVCVPSSCSESEIFRHFNKVVLELSEGLNLTVSLDENHCLTVESEPKMELEHYFSIAFLSFFIVMCLISTVVESLLDSKQSLIVSFSISANYRKMLSRRTKNDFDCIHGLRFLSVCYVVIGHRYLMVMFSPVINSLEILDWVLNYTSTIIIGGTICVDTFFMISGLLVSISFFDHVTKNGTFNLLTFYLYRYFRITPTLGIVVLIYASLIQFFGSGPLWYDTCMFHSKSCRYYWWSTLLHIQSYVNPHALCILQTWYLTCDTIFYYFSPVILYPIWKNKTLGLINFAATYVLGVATSFYLAWSNEYEGAMPVTNQLFETKYFQRHYITPHTRAPPYIIGLGLGYCLYHLKENKIKMGVFTIILGWFIAASLMVISVVGCHFFQLENHESAWTVGVVWMVWACTNGYGGIINEFLSSLIFRVLGRISYAIFLLHLILQIFKNGASKNPIYFSNFTSIYDSFADLLFTIFASFLFTLFFELPLTNLEGLFFTKNKVHSHN